MYHEIERLRRTYSDMEAETANKLSILPNFEAICRLIQIPGGNKRPNLVERHIVTEVIGEQDINLDNATHVRQHSRQMALSREQVEEDIQRRSMGQIGNDDAETAELIQ